MGGVDLILSFVKVGAVFGLLFITMRLLSRTRGVRTNGRGSAGPEAPAIAVLDKTRVGRTSSVVTVRVGGRALLLGVTENQITNLADVTDALESALPADDDVDMTERHSVMDHALDLIRAGKIR